MTISGGSRFSPDGRGEGLKRFLQNEMKIRIHSSRMLTICCSDFGGAGDCISTCTGKGVYPSMHWPGESAQGKCLPRESVCPWGVCAGVSAWGCLPRRDLPRGMSATHTLWTEWQRLVKTLSSHNYVADGYERNWTRGCVHPWHPILGSVNDYVGIRSLRLTGNDRTHH